MLHELWDEGEESGPMFCLAGPEGDAARGLLEPGARLVWTVDAASHFEAMTLFYEHMGWGEYTTDFPEFDKRPYADGSPG